MQVAAQAAGPAIYDVGFTTYVDTDVQAAIPEPATWLMFIISFGLIGARLRKFKVGLPRLITATRIF
jgi:hypothetical protein